VVEAHGHVSDQQPGFVRAGGELVVDGQPTEAGEPGEGALHDPAFRNRHEATHGARGAAAELMRQAEPGQVPGEAPPIAFIGDHRHQALAPTWGPHGQQGQGLYPVVAIGGVDSAGQDAALNIGHNLAFTSIDVLAPVQAPVLKDAWGQPHTLTVEADERGRGWALGRAAVSLHDGLVELLPQPRELPAPEVVVHSRPRGKTGRQTPPLATRAADIAHGINNLTQTMTAFAASRQQQGHNLPLRVRKGLIALNHKTKWSLGTPLVAYWLVFFWIILIP